MTATRTGLGRRINRLGRWSTARRRRKEPAHPRALGRLNQRLASGRGRFGSHPTGRRGERDSATARH